MMDWPAFLSGTIPLVQPLKPMAYHTELLPEPLPPDPMVIFDQWMKEALQKRLQPNPNAMVLATVGPHGDPSARVVLCKEVNPERGFVVFYTNYRSQKGRQLATNPRAAAVIHWDPLHRQIRLEGLVERLDASLSDAYFASRPWQSRLGAWASEQSEPVKSRAELRGALEAAAKRFGTPTPDGDGPDVAGDVQVPRPPHWGGYRLWIDKIELWVEGAGRIHDRARWERVVSELPPGYFDAGPWTATRLQP
jgi:pyridoxamine 5'-phosphate oxidase